MAFSYDAYALCEFYVRGDLGASSSTNIRNGQAFYAESGHRRFNNGLASSIGLGYKPNKYFRTEVAYNRIDNLKYSVNRTLNVNGINILYNDRQKLKLQAIMANIYLDIPLHQRFAPYLGAGLGYSEIAPGRASNVISVDSIGPAGAFIYRTKSSRDLSYALMTGVVVSVSKNLDLDVGYRFQDFGRNKSFNVRTQITPRGDVGRVDHLPSVQGPRIQTHTVMAGIRYNFETCCPALLTERKRDIFEPCCPESMTES